MAEHKCLVCECTESTKWRKSTCANCYARALRYYKKLKQPIDISGYATLVEQELNITNRDGEG